MDKRRFGFYFFLLLILLVAAKLYAVSREFIPALAAGCILAVLFNPVYTRLLRWTGRKSVAAGLVIASYAVLIIAPCVFIILSIQAQVGELLSENSVEELQQALKHAESFLSNYIGSESLDKQISILLSHGQGIATAVVQKLFFGITGFTIAVFITMFLLYYLLINSDDVIGDLKKYIPLSDKNIDILFYEMHNDTRTLVLGQLIVALMQGVLAAVGFVIFGVPGVLLWGAVMTFLSFLPLLGSFIVWGPAVVWLLAKGDYFNGFGLFIWGAVVVGASDNLVRPKLTSSMGKIHPVTVLLGAFIGIKEWGVIGLVLGPLVISFLLALIRIFQREYYERGNTTAREEKPETG